MSKNTVPTRPGVVKNITIVSAVIAALCLLAGGFLLYTTAAAIDQAAAFNAKVLAVVVIALGIAYAFLTVEFYRLRPWSYRVMRAMVRGSLSPVFAMWGWYDAIEDDEVQRAFGVRLKKKR
jgi:hypothetical protein